MHTLYVFLFLISRKFTDRPHVAGSEIQLEYGKKIEKEWTLSKTFDKVEVFPYNVLLSYLEKGETNKVQVLNSTGNVVMEFKGKEKVSTLRSNLRKGFGERTKGRRRGRGSAGFLYKPFQNRRKLM